MANEALGTQRRKMAANQLQQRLTAVLGALGARLGVVGIERPAPL
jgi:hypothetical protein